MNLGSQGAKTMTLASSGSSRKAGDGIPDQFPAGLRVLVVDDDPTCLMILEKMLRTCLYEVTKSNRAEVALSRLRENRNGFDIIISDVHMPDMDGFKLLELVGLEMDLPVIMMSADDSKSVVMKGVTHGACDYLIKPVRMEALKNIWQHVVRKKKHEWKDFDQSGSIEEGDRQQKPPADDGDFSSSANEGSWRNNSKRRKEEEDEAEEKEDTSALKKPRVVWSVELHQQFMAAVDQLGVDKAVPKKILELMNVPGLTRENVASHLQKYRLYLRRLSGVSQHQAGIGNPYLGSRDAAFGSISSINGLDLQALAATAHIPAPSLATLQAATIARSLPKSTISMPILDQRSNIFSFEDPSKSRFGEGNNNSSSLIASNITSYNNKQVNLLHGIPTTMEPKQLANFRGRDSSSLMVQMNQRPLMMNDNSNNSSAHISRLSSAPLVQPNFTTSGVFTRNELAGNVRASTSVYSSSASQPSSMADFSVNQKNPDTGLAKGEMSSGLKVSRGYIDPSYDIFNDLAQNKTSDWDLQNVGLSFGSMPHSNMQGGSGGSSSSLNVRPSVLVNQGFGSAANTVQQLNTVTGENSLRVKSETIPEVSCQNTLFPDPYGQEDLLSALLKQQDGMGPVPNDFGFDGFPPLDNLPV